MRRRREPLSESEEENLIIRCIECNDHVVVQSLQAQLKLRCPRCGGGKFKAVPVKNFVSSYSSQHENDPAAQVPSLSLLSPEEPMEDFLAVKEVELGVYQINLPNLFSENRKRVLAAGAREGVYVIRLPFLEGSMDENKKKKKKHG